MDPDWAEESSTDQSLAPDREHPDWEWQEGQKWRQGTDDASKRLLERMAEAVKWAKTNQSAVKLIEHVHTRLAEAGIREGYFRSRDVAEATGLSASTVNYWFRQLDGITWALDGEPLAATTRRYRTNRLKRYQGSGGGPRAMPRLVRVTFGSLAAIPRPQTYNSRGKVVQ